MAQCKLCKEAEAVNKGSHIIPHFIMKRIDNEIGSTDRNKELGFMIGQKDTQSYFGSAVLPEKLEPVFGELSDEDISQMRNIPSIEFNIFCSNCEDKFGKIESEYSKTLDKYDSNSSYVTNTNREIAFLFWLSLLWRISLVKKYNLVLKSEEEELFRCILSKYLATEIKNIDYGSVSKEIEKNKFAYKLLRCPNYSNDNATVLICNPIDRTPYSILIDEYVFCFYFSNNDVSTLPKDFFGFEESISKAEPTTASKGEIITPINSNEYRKCMEKALGLIAKQRMDYYNWMFDEVHKNFIVKGVPMPNEMKGEIIKRITDSEKKLGRKFTQQDAYKSIFEVVGKHLKK